MIASWVNGQPSDSISISDRGMLYGQSLFETIAVKQQKPLLLQQHLLRLSAGCRRLFIPLDLQALEHEISAFIATNKERTAILRVTITMGEGGRGYLNPVVPKPNRILSLYTSTPQPKHYWQEGIVLGLVELQLSSQPNLAGMKHSNRLEQILARSEWQEGWQEALLLNQCNQVIEATQSNVFIVNDNTIITPELSQNGVAGVMRDYLLNVADKIGVETQIMSLSLSDISAADEIFVTNSLIGLWPVKYFLQHQYTNHKVTQKLLKLIQEDGVISTF